MQWSPPHLSFRRLHWPSSPRSLLLLSAVVAVLFFLFNVSMNASQPWNPDTLRTLADCPSLRTGTTDSPKPASFYSTYPPGWMLSTSELQAMSAAGLTVENLTSGCAANWMGCGSEWTGWLAMLGPAK